MLISFKNRNVGPMVSGELTFARWLGVFAYVMFVMPVSVALQTNPKSRWRF